MMGIEKLGIRPGEYLYSNCGKTQSINNCQLAMIGPVNQREDFLDASVAHAVKTHGHEDSPGLRSQLDKSIETIEM